MLVHRLATLAMLLSVGCGSAAGGPLQASQATPDAASGGPPLGTYSVVFPSAAAAVSTDTVEVMVFDASWAPSGLCSTLVQKRKAHQGLPTQVLDVDPAALCDVLGSAGDGAATRLDLPFGEYAFLAIGQRQGQDFMLGCALAAFSRDSASVAITMQPVTPETVVPQLPPTCNADDAVARHCDPATAAECSP